MKGNSFVLLAAASMAAIAPSAQACSICRCGDPTFNALGKEGVAQTGWRVALDWEQVKKTEGEPAELDSLRERRTTLLLAWGINDSLGVFARLPWAERQLFEAEDGHTHSTSGLADPEIYAQARLWSSPFEGDVGTRTSLYAVFGVKTPWGENKATHAGGDERLDEHVQPGTGSTDWFGGLSASYQINPSSALFASVQYRRTGENDFDYRYGRVVLANLAYEHKLTARLDGVVEVNYRHAGTDRIDVTGERDANTGGSIAYFTPRLLFGMGKGWVLRGSAQLPLSQSGLHGLQHEKAVVNFGVTKLFTR